VYFVSTGDVTQSGANLTLIGAIYTAGNFTHKTCQITGPVCVTKTITNNAAAACTFTTATIPWFDNRAIPQQATLPLFTTNHIGNGPDIGPITLAGWTDGIASDLLPAPWLRPGVKSPIFGCGQLDLFLTRVRP